MRKASRWFTDEAVNSKTNPFDPDSSEYEAWNLGNGFGIAEGRRLERRAMRREMNDSIKGGYSLISNGWVLDWLAARSKRGRRKV